MRNVSEPSVRDATGSDLALDALQRVLEDYGDDRGADLTLYWHAFDVAIVEALKGAGSARPEEIERLLREVPRPANIRLDIIYFTTDPETHRYVDFGRQDTPSRPADNLLLIASSDPDGRDDGAHLALLDRGLGRWELDGSMTVPDRWDLRNVSWSASGRGIAVAWDYQRGTQVGVLRVRTMDIGGWWRSRTFEFIDGFVKLTAAGLLVEHQPPHAQEGEAATLGSRANPRFLPTEGLDWRGMDLDGDLPGAVFSLVEFENPKQLFPRTGSE